MFHAEHIGRLLRPETLLREKEAHKAGRLDAGGLRAVEDCADAVGEFHDLALENGMTN